MASDVEFVEEIKKAWNLRNYRRLMRAISKRNDKFISDSLSSIADKDKEIEAWKEINSANCKALFALDKKYNEQKSEIVQLKFGNMSSFDYQRLIEWMKDSNRTPPELAFTAGATRDAARAFLKYLHDLEAERGMVRALKEIADFIPPKFSDTLQPVWSVAFAECQIIARKALGRG